jgi:protein-tyrosine-phosphatase
MTDKVYRTLFLCTGNSARSIMAESILNRQGLGRFEAHSAGSHPTGRVHPIALELLERYNYPTARLRSKSWDEFARPDAPPLQFVFTVCDRAAGEVCPVWPGQPMTAHWGVEDPAAFVGPEEKKLQFFRAIYFQLERRIQILINLPIASLDRLSLQKRLDEIGRTRAEAPAK